MEGETLHAHTCEYGGSEKPGKAAMLTQAGGCIPIVGRFSSRAWLHSILNYLFIIVCPRSCMWMCMYCLHACACTYMWKPVGGLGCCSSDGVNLCGDWVSYRPGTHRVGQSGWLSSLTSPSRLKSPPSVAQKILRCPPTCQGMPCLRHQPPSSRSQLGDRIGGKE